MRKMLGKRRVAVLHHAGQALGARHTVTAPPEEMTHEDVLRVKLQLLRQEHGDLDAAVQAMETQSMPDMLAIKRLKKKKLELKDRIARIEDELTPDIIA